MPALDNPRWERFALALFAGLNGKTRLERAQSTAYLVAYPNCKPGNSAESAASQLLRRIKPITDRVLSLNERARKANTFVPARRFRRWRALHLGRPLSEYVALASSRSVWSWDRMRLLFRSVGAVYDIRIFPHHAF